MARINNLTNFLTDVASAIKTKKGSETSIPAANFDTEILSLPSGGTYQTKSININNNGNYNLLPDTGYDAMSEVTISVAISPNLQDLTLTQNGTYSAGQGYDGIGQVIVNVPGAENLDPVLTAQEQKLAELEALVDSKISGLDSAYKELEYIESSGTQYIDTLIKINGGLRVKTNLILPSSSVDGHIFGGRNGSGKDAFGVYVHLTTIRNDYNASISGTTASPVNSTFYIDKNKGNLYINDIITHTQYTNTIENAEFSGNYNLFIFCRNHNGEPQAFTTYILYNFKIYNNDVLVRNFIPVKRKSDNEVGLYDKVSKTFFTNQGTGTFIAGPEI